MKKLVIISVVTLAAVGAKAQGTIVFNDRITGGVYQTRVYAPDTGNPALVVSGNTSADIPAGTQTYTGQPLGGGTTGTSFGNGNRYTAQIWAVAGLGQPTSSLQAVTQYTANFRTTIGLAGYFLPPTLTSDAGIPNTTAGTGTLQLRVWDNGGGVALDWPTAETLNLTRGSSPVWNEPALGGTFGGPPQSSPNITGLQSFNLQSVPEPSTIALGVMGAAAFLLRRRNK